MWANLIDTWPSELSWKKEFGVAGEGLIVHFDFKNGILPSATTGVPVS